MAGLPARVELDSGHPETLSRWLGATPHTEGSSGHSKVGPQWQWELCDLRLSKSLQDSLGEGN